MVFPLPGGSLTRNLIQTLKANIGHAVTLTAGAVDMLE